ncbi:thioredoxin family protein [Evansella cellulosilytica]|uniref:Thioredoxin domain-containing protein n=1 Tax=Evansella cellulosilytica (strain ATCC 21833 / DSM 2522 / FERM P-1141 / JCM 9156 / N-4) TaxID=649639 RepID=E6U182_EVAC2|nr:thioredoxin family protein [Evansella cellulosilytica]ADU31528.1 Thioredoxin domain-containing protein [Evansella cellulosilytica DSM 2522]
MKQLESREQFEQLTNGTGTVFMFSAGWCPDCVVIEPDLPAIEKEFPEFDFYKVNRDEFIELCQELEIMGIPSFVAYKNGVEVNRFVNKNRKTKEEIVSFLREAKSK